MEKRLSEADFILRKNNSKSLYTGKRIETSSSGTLEIVGKTDRYKLLRRGESITRSYEYFLCRFDDGTYVEVNQNPLRLGNVLNPYKKTVCGVGFLGQGDAPKTIGNNQPKEQVLWRGIITRCYTKDNSKRYKPYNDCSVVERWHNYQLFFEDVVCLPNYHKWKQNDERRGYTLDKDLKQPNTKHKVYSKDTCVFLSFEENQKEMNTRTLSNKLTGKTYVGTRLSDKYEECFFNMHAFAKKYNLYHQNIFDCLKGNRQTVKGWAFKIKKEEE